MSNVTLVDLKALDEKLKTLTGAFDKELPIMRKFLWEVADKYGIEGKDVFIQYFDWKSKDQAN